MAIVSDVKTLIFILVSKLDISKNPKLVEALRVKAAPTFTIYKSSEMVWRQTGEQDSNTLIGLVSEYLD